MQCVGDPRALQCCELVCGLYKRPLEMSLEAGFTATPANVSGVQLARNLNSEKTLFCFCGSHFLYYFHDLSMGGGADRLRLLLGFFFVRYCSQGLFDSKRQLVLG